MTTQFVNRLSTALQSQSVCVIGGGGFIGSHLVDALLDEGCRLRVLSRKLPGLLDSKALLSPNLTAHNVDIRNGALLNEAIQGCDYVVHLASSSLPKDSNLNPKEDVSINLIGSLM